jgi:serine/threonine-protein kinase ATR
MGLNLILVELVEYLGHSNPLLCGVAYNEVRMDVQVLVLADDNSFRILPILSTRSLLICLDHFGRPSA